MAVNGNSRFSQSNWVQRPCQEIKQTTWLGLAASLSHCLGLCLYATNRAPSDVGMPPTWKKGSHLPSGTTKLGNLRDGHNSITAPTAEPDLWDSSALFWEPTQGCQKCDRVQRYARWIGRLSHQSSDLSHPHNPLQKVVIHALLDTRFKGMQVVTYPTNCQTTEVRLTKSSPKMVWLHAHE